MTKSTKLISMIIFLLAVTGCSTPEVASITYRPMTDIRTLDITVSPESFENVAINIFSYGETEPTNLSQIHLKTPRDPLNLMIRNGVVGADADVVLKLFYNYEEVAFRIRGSNEYMTELFFTLEGGYRFDIPIYLDLPLEPKETVSKLTFGFFYFVDEFAFNIEDPYPWMQGGIFNLEINYGIDEPFILLAEEFTEVIHYPDWTGNAFLVNQQFELTDEDIELNVFYFPPTVIQTSPNERLELAFQAGLHGSITEPVTDILIISMLEWQQIPMSGQPFLWIPVDKDDYALQHGFFYIYVPAEPGFYDFTAIAIPNPTSPLSWNNFFPLEIAIRFTIEVVAD